MRKARPPPAGTGAICAGEGPLIAKRLPGVAEWMPPGPAKAVPRNGTTVVCEFLFGTSTSVTREPARAAATIQPAVRLVAAAATCPARGSLRDRVAVGSGVGSLSPGIAGSSLADGECSFTVDILTYSLRLQA